MEIRFLFCFANGADSVLREFGEMLAKFFVVFCGAFVKYIRTSHSNAAKQPETYLMSQNIPHLIQTIFQFHSDRFFRLYPD